MGKTREGRVNYSGEDRISELPDAILANILSRLSTSNAGRTCVVSRRWRYVWTHVTCLDYEFDILPNVYTSYKCQRRGEECVHDSKFKSLTQFFRLHQGTLDRIKILVNFHGYYGPLCQTTILETIPAWIESAEQKRVQSLEIELYDQNLVKPFKSPVGVSCIKYLKHLTLKGPGISSEIVEHFLSNSPILEHLSISGWKRLSENLEVFGSSSLKFLEISDCEFVYHQVKISAPNLVSFAYNGIFTDVRLFRPISLDLEHVPSLVSLSYSPMLVTSVPACTKGFLSLSSFLHQLETVNLGSSDCEPDRGNQRVSLGCWECEPDRGNQWIRNIVLPEDTELTSLKNLSLSITAYPFEKTLLDLASWIERSPFLRNFTLEIKWRKIPSFEKEILQKLKRFPHQYLKVVKFCGFVGYGNEMELAAYLIENAMVLEEIIIEPNKEKLPLWASRWAKNQKATKIRKSSIEGHAKSQLNKKLPPGAKLCFL